ncbi:hypothetical protein OSTOST_12347 [Ostertagia ostertagi]
MDDNFRPVQVDRMCHENATDCYTIYIRKLDYGEGRWLMVLYTIFDSRPNVLGESLISLLHPDGENIVYGKTYCVDLKTWKIDHPHFCGILHSSYGRLRRS